MFKSKEKKQFLFLIFMLASLQGGLALAALLEIPSNASNAFLFGLSLLRFLMAATLIILVVFFSWLGWLTWRKPSWYKTWFDKEKHSKKLKYLHWLLGASTFFTAVLLVFLRYYDPTQLLPLYQRAKSL